MIEQVTRIIVTCDWCRDRMRRTGSRQEAVFISKGKAQDAAENRGWDQPDGKHWCGKCHKKGS